MTTKRSLKTPAQIVSLAKAGVSVCSPHAASQRLNSDESVVVIDVRDAAEYESGHLNSSINIPRGLLEWKIAKFCPDASTPLLVHCASGGRAVLAAKSLTELGYDSVTAIDGSFSDIQASMAEIEMATHGEVSQ